MPNSNELPSLEELEVRLSNGEVISSTIVRKVYQRALQEDLDAGLDVHKACVRVIKSRSEFDFAM